MKSKICSSWTCAAILIVCFVVSLFMPREASMTLGYDLPSLNVVMALLAFIGFLVLGYFEDKMEEE